MKENKRRVARAKITEVDNKTFSGDPIDLKGSSTVKFTFETALDFIIYSLDILIVRAKKGSVLNEDQLKYFEDMREFFSTRVTSLGITPAPGNEIPYNYKVDYTAQEGDIKKEVEEKIKKYLGSKVFNFIIGSVDPQVLEIIRQKEELAKKEEELEKEKERLLKEKKRLDKVKKKAGEKTKLRTGKHFIDNTLKNNFDNNQLPLFDTLSESIKKKIIEEDTSIEMINNKGEGINLTKGELKLLLCLAKTLQDKSNITAPENGDYYLGKKINQIDNSVDITTQEGNKVTLKTPAMSFTLYEITKEFVLEDNPGGADIKEVAKILYSLAYSSDKKALIRYTRKEDLGKGRERQTKIETYSPLINIFNFEQEDLLNGKKIDQAKEVIITLHPVFIDQIDKLYIELPLPKDIMTAYGGSNVSEIVFKLIFELSRALSNRKKLPKDEEGDYIYTIGVKKLQKKIAETYYRQFRYKLINQYFEKATETAKALGMLKSYIQEVGSTGEILYKFTLSKDW
jgi:hypothetical protein